MLCIITGGKILHQILTKYPYLSRPKGQELSCSPEQKKEHYELHIKTTQLYKSTCVKLTIEDGLASGRDCQDSLVTKGCCM